MMQETFLMNHYNIEGNEKVSIIMNWLGCEGFRFVQTLTDSEEKKCKTS